MREIACHVVVEQDRGAVAIAVDGAVIGKGMHEGDATAPVPLRHRVQPPPASIADPHTNPVRSIVVGGVEGDVAVGPSAVSMLGTVGQCLVDPEKHVGTAVFG